jgi:phenylpropionate dioxygenase-like ring-hydroxylating dioxygenase large terminal subunit
VRPTAADRTIVTAGALSPPGATPTDPALAQAAADFVTAFLGEDRWICERGQRGMQSRRSQGGQLVELERVVADFHRYLAHRLVGQKPPERFTAERTREIWPD